jgi:hypothetical protein
LVILHSEIIEYLPKSPNRAGVTDHPYAEPHKGAQVATDRQVANRAPDLSGTPEKKGVGAT